MWDSDIREMAVFGIGGVFVSVLAVTWAIFKILPYFRKFRDLHSALDKEFPHLPFHWFWGNAHQVDGKIKAFFDKHMTFIQDGAKVFCYWIGFFRPVMGTSHPDTIKAIVRTAEPKAKGGGGYDFLESWLGDGLLTSSGSKWERNRRLLTPAFHFDILKPYVKIYNHSAIGFVRNIELKSKGGNSVEVFGPAGLATLDTMLQCALSYTDDIQEKGAGHPYVKAIARMSTLITARAMNPIYYVKPLYNISSSGREYAKHVDFVHKFSEEIIESRKKTLGSDPEQVKKRHLDFLDILLTARDETGQGLTDREIRDEVDTFMFEGHDTTSSAISWCLYCLALYPEEQQKVLQEVLQVVGDKEDVEWSDLGKLQRVTMFLRESMRLYPPVPFVSRQLTKPLELDGVRVPKGVFVDINVYMVHRNPLAWENSTEFRPERFDPDTSAGRNPYSFVPFSAGPRNCIGQNFAMNELKVMVCQLVRKFQISLDQKRPAVPKIEIVLRAEDGLYLNFKPRK